MNRLLQAQVETHWGGLDSLPEEMVPLLKAISNTYDGFVSSPDPIESSDDTGSVDLRSEKETAQELRHTVAALTATIESTTDGILVVDLNGRIAAYNQMFRTMWGIPETLLASGMDEPILAHALAQLQASGAMAARIRQLWDDLAAESVDILRLRDGRIFERNSKPHVVEGSAAGRVWCFRDITERMHAEEEQAHLVAKLEAAILDLANANQELNDFAYVVSHDLKAPLRGIRTISDWISTDYADKLDEMGREQLHLLVSRVDRMHHLIDGILQYSRIGRTRETTVPIDLRTLVTEVIDTLAPPAHITITVTEDLPVITAEYTKTFQVFQNLLSNAIKYMDKPAGHIEVGCTELEGTWRFSVTDNGPGIEEKDFTTIFQMFQTLGARDEFDSTGVGLALVKRIVEKQGGTIWVESEPGRGSTFLFTLPKQQEEKTDAQLQARITC